MLADPHSKKRSRNTNEYTEEEFQAALALLTDKNEHDNKKRKPEYWSDEDDWPKYDHNNEHPYDPTLKLLTPNEQGDINNLQQPPKETLKQQSPSKPLRPTGNVHATNMERLDYAIAYRKKKPRARSIGGRKTKRSAKRKTKRKLKRKTKCKTKRKTKRTAKRKKGGSGKDKIPITKDGLYLIPGTGNHNDHIVEVEDPAAEQGDINNVAKIRGTGTTPVYDPKTGLFIQK